MPQAKLPDINAGFVKYRSHGLMCIEQKVYTGAAGALNNINALLPDDYKVEINTIKYNELMQQKVTVSCSHCRSETNRLDLKVMTVMAPLLLDSLFGVEHEKVWFCGKCNKENNLLHTKMKIQAYQKPYYFKVVPEPPQRKSGLKSRTTFHRDFVKWFYNYMEEIEYQLGLYRKEYLGQFADVPDDGEAEPEDAD